MPLNDNILKKILEMSKDKDNRVDKYIDSLRGALKDSDDWSSNHDVVFQEMIKEVKTSRLKSIIAFVIALMLVVFSAYYSFIEVPNQKKQIATQIKNANLPLKFKHSSASKGELLVIYSTDNLSEEQKALFNELKIHPIVGRITGLGKDSRLSIKVKDRENWEIYPLGGSEVLGELNIDGKIGTTDNLAELSVNKVQNHTDLSHVYIKVVNVPKNWTDPKKGRTVDYKVKYGVRSSGNIVWGDTLTVKSSPGGVDYNKPQLIHHKHWNKFYIVSIAVGHWGKDATEPLPKVYNLKSRVYEIGLND